MVLNYILVGCPCFLTITYTFLSICYLSPNRNHKILRTEHLVSNLITREQIFSISYKQFTNTNNWRRLYRSIKYRFRGLGGSRRPFVLSEINLGSFSAKTSVGITLPFNESCLTMSLAMRSAMFRLHAAFWLVFIRLWGRMVMHNHVKPDAPLLLVHFDRRWSALPKMWQSNIWSVY